MTNSEKRGQQSLKDPPIRAPTENKRCEEDGQNLGENTETQNRDF